MPVSTDRLVVIGGDAAGMSAAAQARRLRPASELDIVVLEQGPEISYSACGIPYWIGGQVSDRDALIARTPAAFEADGITVHTHVRAVGIDLDAGEVRASDGRRYGYDNLVVATGARHSYFGHEEWERDAPGLKSIVDATRIRRRVLLAFEAAEMEPDPERRKALLTFVLVGAGFIPYIDRGDILVTRPSQRKTAVILFTLFCILGLVLTFVGIFFRGPGYTFVIPYVTAPGMYFSL